MAAWVQTSSWILPHAGLSPAILPRINCNRAVTLCTESF